MEDKKIFEAVVIDTKAKQEIEDSIKQAFNADSIEIEDAKQYENIAELLKNVKGKTKEVKEFYTDTKAQAHSIHKEITTMEKETLQPLVDFEKVGKRAIADYTLELEENSGDMDLTVPEVKGISTRDKFSFEIIDTSLVPRDYLMLNEKAIKSMITSTNGEIEIPGVKIIKDKTVSVRS